MLCIMLEVTMMVNASEIISNNIMNIMKQNGKKQIDLAEYLGVSKQVVSRMLTGGRMISAIELQKISEFLGTAMENLVKRPEVFKETNAIKAFMGKVETQEAKDGLGIADEIANFICFYARTRENAEEMMKPWEA